MMKSNKKAACVALSLCATLAVAAAVLPAVLTADASDQSAAVQTAAVQTAATTAYNLSENSDVKIKADGVYRITGSSEEGSITVAKDVTATIILDNASLRSSTTAPIVCKSGSNVTIELVGTSTLTNAEDPANETSDDAAIADAFEGAAIKAKASSTLTITGDGTLTINGSAKNGIKGGDDAAITIESGTLNITAANDAINANGDLNVTGGTLTIDAGDDGLHADGTVTIGTEGSENGPTVNIVNSSEGIEGAQVVLNSGTGSIRSGDDGVNAASDDAGEIYIKVNGGDWTVNADGDGLDAGGESNRGNGAIYLNGGTVTVYGSSNNGNGALDSESGIVYNGGTLLAIGMSGMAETPSGSNVLVFGSSGMGGGMMGGMNGKMGGTSEQSGQAPQFGQGKQNGDMQPDQNRENPFGNNQSRGFGGQMPPMGGMNGGTDSQMPRQGGMNGGFGGQLPQQGSQPNSPMDQQSAGVTIIEGSRIVITDSNGNVVCETVGVKSANSVIFAGEDVNEGETYTLTVDGSEVATATAGSGAAAPQMGGVRFGGM